MPADCNDNNPCTDDTCTESGCIHPPHVGECRPASGPCDVAESCDGNGMCPPDASAPAGTPCGDQSDTVCTNPDTCNGSGACQPNNAPPATVCRPAAGQCDAQELCSGGVCPADGGAPNGTPCDDGSVCTQSDQCNGSGTCVGSDPMSCDDGNPCTQDTCDPNDGCDNDPTPATQCKTAAKSILILKQKGGARDKLLFKWIRGAPLSLTELGDPLSDTTYSLCLYTGSTYDRLLGITVPPGAPNWRKLGSKGYKYKDLNGLNSGLGRVLLKSSEMPNRSKVLVKGRGVNLPDPTLGDLPLTVTAQLVNNDNGACVEAIFDSNIRRNTTSLFKAKAP